MTAMAGHWIADVNGRHALVEGEEQLTLWTRIRGWRLAGEPTGQTQTCIAHPDGLTGCVPFAALAGWAEQGWRPGPPPEPVDLTRDPTPEPSLAPVEAVKSKPAAGGDKKE